MYKICLRLFRFLSIECFNACTSFQVYDDCIVERVSGLVQFGKFFGFGYCILSFVCDKYCPIMD